MKITVQTQTTAPKKQNLHSSPIRPPASKIDNLGKNHSSNPKSNNKAERSPQSKRDHTPTSSSQEHLKLSNPPNQSTEPSTSKIDAKNRFSLIERIETEESHNKKKS